jgi:hypothetical protein
MAYDKEIASAMVGAMSELTDPPMDSKNPHFRNRYASLKSCLDTVRPVLARHGLVLSQFVVSSETGADRLVTRLLHQSGQFVEDEGISLVGADNMQKLGSAMSYGRRYGLLSVLGLVGDPDDDAEIASVPVPAPVKPIPVPVVSDDIPLTADDEREDLTAWAADARANLSRIRNVAELKSWAGVNKETLDKLQASSPADAKDLLTTFNNRKKELNNA